VIRNDPTWIWRTVFKSETINERLGVEVREVFTEGPEAFANFVRTILSIAAPLHVLQRTTTGKRPEPVKLVAQFFETKH
jgi:hypothetical protein